MMDANAFVLDRNARYTVDGYRGIAFYVLGYSTDDSFEDEDEPPLDFEWVQAVMVGDDRVHQVAIEDLTLIKEEDYCGACGQVGCTADGRG